MQRFNLVEWLAIWTLVTLAVWGLAMAAWVAL